MKKLLPALLFLSLYSCNSSRVYIVRHAEKSAEPANNPHLTTEGKLRAEFLKDHLKDKKIGAIFSTNYSRTIQTATPLSQLKKIPVEIYGNDTLDNFINRVIRSGKNSLVVAHSNTLIAMIHSLDLPHNITSIPDNDYDNIFIIKVKNGKAVKITETTYGMVSPPVK